MKSISQKRRFAGFTLIELLVVISIIAVLMAVMMPALRKAREQAKLAICKSNLKQISSAVILYASEGDGKFPPSILLDKGQENYLFPGFLTVEPAAYWGNHPLPYPKDRMLSTYLGDRVADGEIFYCPLSPSKDKEKITAIYKDPFAGNGTYVCSFGMFWGGYTFKDSSGKVVFTGPKKMSDSSNSLLCSDVIFDVGGDVRTTHKTVAGGAESGSAGFWSVFAEADKVLPKLKSDYAFADGHVETIKGSETVGLPYYSDSNKLYMPRVCLKNGSR